MGCRSVERQKGRCNAGMFSGTRHLENRGILCICSLWLSVGFLERVPSLQESQLASAAARHPGEPSDIPTGLPL